jgi:hypothetical protein
MSVAWRLVLVGGVLRCAVCLRVPPAHDTVPHAHRVRPPPGEADPMLLET